jgi:hypothetical protein
MLTNADLAARLLRDTARFFRSIAGENPSLRAAFIANADIFEQVADLVEDDPDGEAGDAQYATGDRRHR